ncbi:DddA-like double-stranded DNA deaminase toxin [Longispora fulva]|uniref:DddA-like double-stranded DNA deaminase toxin n=1 Tax=Longispora fulva TaxID=619741 RepID=UPI0018C9A92A|nr:DddA-like double-stranded DNA deaminase toxin [Longispora fulva]
MPAHVRVRGARFRPRPPKDGRATIGHFNGQELRSGGTDTSIADDLDVPRLRSGVPPDVAYLHVEAKVAAHMRRHNMPAAEVIIDNTVCGSNEWDRDWKLTCEKVLPSILPNGSTLTVWVTRDGGQSWWRGQFEGTGERIKAKP